MIANLFIIAALLTGIALDWELHQLVLFACVIWQIVKPIPLKTLVAATITGLCLVPVALAMDKPLRAEQLAVAVFIGFFLCIVTIALQWIEEAQTRRSHVSQ